MSYILDALRKADAQRVRDPARGIHAQADGATPVTARRRGSGERWLWAASAGLVLAAGAWAWARLGDTTLAPAGTVAPAASVGAQVIVPPAVARVSPAPVAPAPQPAISPPPAADAVPAAAEVRPPARGFARQPQSAPALQAPAAPAAVTAPPAAAASAPPAPVVTAKTADRVWSMADLPADVQQALPKFSVTGGVYSDNVAQRMLIVNGQVFNEGSEIAPGVVVEQIRSRSALLKFRGLSIAQPY